MDKYASSELLKPVLDGWFINILPDLNQNDPEVAKYIIQNTLWWIGVGIAWASILSLPYAILSSALPPARMGVYMGVFNFFIVIPEIIALLTFQPLVKYVFDNNPLYVVMLGGVSLLVAALLTIRVQDREEEAVAVEPVTLAAAAD